MDLIIAVVLGFLALYYICSPLWSGAQEIGKAGAPETWHSLEQLEIDRSTGKIDQAEYDELKDRLPTAAKVPTLESLIFQARRKKRVEQALENEVLQARGRSHKRDLN